MPPLPTNHRRFSALHSQVSVRVTPPLGGPNHPLLEQHLSWWQDCVADSRRLICDYTHGRVGLDRTVRITERSGCSYPDACQVSRAARSPGLSWPGRTHSGLGNERVRSATVSVTIRDEMITLDHHDMGMRQVH